MKEYLKKHLINSRGKAINDKVIVIESDDWGSIRIPNKEVQEQLAGEGLINLKDPFSAYDCLESAEDYEMLINVLQQFDDQEGRHPVITANMVMGNPDFTRIKDSDFSSFFWEPFYNTYESYYPQQSTNEALIKGIFQGVIYPQFHGYVHLNQYEWLKRLQSGDSRFLKAFDLDCFAINDKSASNNRANLMATYDYQSESELCHIKDDIVKGLIFFEKTFGFPSKTTIAPCYVWNDATEQVFSESGVQSMQSSYIQQYNDLESGTHKRIWQKTGSINSFGQRYFVRNVMFEPSLNPNVNWVDKALESIAIAFFWNKPAIISSHRINYVSGLSRENRDHSLEQLYQLLGMIVKKWPDVLFIHSADLNEIYSGG
ncbi:MAG: hypothetical protein ACXIUD_11065 [Mongoliitalea sp.]